MSGGVVCAGVCGGVGGVCGGGVWGGRCVRTSCDLYELKI